MVYSFFSLPFLSCLFVENSCLLLNPLCFGNIWYHFPSWPLSFCVLISQVPHIHVKQSLLGLCGTSLKGQKKICGERIGGALRSSGQRGWSKSWNWNWIGKL